ncbi:family 43 glycosylhydrolase [Segatella copri]|uniref:Family 43 glycosylhydrolase n=1 Tax=Segatella copri TaxID=165179 RepID=A0AA90V1R6_9BACT|nr:family 43 glycosylhydrolase [Segatella copri]MQN85359.1 family 43 glycosylhydrolase [Segatella copri]
MKKLFIILGLMAAMQQVNAQNFTKQWCADNGDFLLTATDPEGEWKVQKVNGFYYDSGLLFDEATGRRFVVAGINDIRVTELDENFNAISSNKQVINKPDAGLEGSHMYHIGDYYYIYATYGGGYDRSQTIFRSKNPFGPYEEHEGRLFEKQNIHQGGLVETQTGEWWTILFKDAGTIGRIPYLEPVVWKDGWPIIGKNGIDVSKDGKSYKKPNVGKEYPRTYLPTNDGFNDEKLGMQWEWNHNPDNTAWSLTENPGHLRLHTTGIVDESDDTKLNAFLQARNTLTQRMFGYDKEGASTSTDTYGTICLDVSHMKEGDVAGLCVFQDPYAYIGVRVIDGQKKVVTYRAPWWEPKADWQGNVDDTEHYKVFGTTTASHNDKIYLRAVANFKTNKVKFYLSWDGKNWMDSRQDTEMRYTLKIFTGNRFAIFNYATRQNGGYVDVDWFSTEENIDENVFNNLTAIEQVEAKTKRIVSRQFYNVAGVKLSAPQKGLNIVKTRYEDGTEKAYSFVK